MAAVRSRTRFSAGGQSTGQGARTRIEGLVPLLSGEPYAPSIDGLDEISGWLGTFSERLRVARCGEWDEIEPVVQEPEAHYRLRRAELS